ncbi:unnamed protein product [Parnassius apollo]|uniref:(apollo) hypothetical protein n=1 Tax=Parnassius apollo TaxID=110799 RepID=A0A8S3XQQ3_PARAO|nr:unnamed protein product [Parnassius apollo]
MLTMKTEIEGIKSTYATLECVNELRTEVYQLKTDSPSPASAFKMNMKRGAWLDSGPMGLSHDYDMLPNEISTKNINELFIIKSPSTQSEKLRVERHKPTENKLNGRQRLSVKRTQASALAGCCEGGVRSIVNQEANTQSGPAVTLHSSSTNLQLEEQMTTTDKAGDTCALETCKPERSQNINSEDWQKMVYRKKQNKYRYVGKSGIARDLECTFRAADRKIPMFITNVNVKKKKT